MTPEQEIPPKRWRGIYALVIGTLAIVIIVLYIFTEHYK